MNTMTVEQKQAYEWAKNQDYQSVAARYAKTLAGLADELQAEIERLQAERDMAEVENEDVLSLRKGSPVWYVDFSAGEIESGEIFGVSFGADGRLDSFSVNFECGDFDEFYGDAMGDSVFTSKAKAEQALFKARLGK